MSCRTSGAAIRAGKKPPITEQTLSDAANDVMRTSGAPDWARTSVSELHFIRMALRDLLPRFVGTVDSELQLSDKMTPVEAVFVVMTLGKGMVLEPDDFLNGPDGYVARAHERQSSAPPAGAVLRARVTTGAILDLANGRAFDDQHGLAATSARRLLDQLRFPR